MEQRGSKNILKFHTKDFAIENSMLYIETSAKTRLQVHQAFNELVLKIIETPELLEGTAPLGAGGNKRGIL